MKLHYPITLIFLITIFSHTLMAMESNLIQNIVLSGNESFSDEQIHAKMKTNIGASYDEEVLKQDFERIIEFYRKNGFQFARIDEMRQLIKEFADGVFLHIYIDEGTIGEISVEGNTRTKDYVIIRELLFQVGDAYTVEDELESERILRRKSYLGT
ncbi:MAG: POTRA domain-containing protein, partial [Candidatus Poribacteria bacterium]